MLLGKLSDLLFVLEKAQIKIKIRIETSLYAFKYDRNLQLSKIVFKLVRNFYCQVEGQASFLLD